MESVKKFPLSEHGRNLELKKKHVIHASLEILGVHSNFLANDSRLELLNTFVLRQKYRQKNVILYSYITELSCDPE